MIIGIKKGDAFAEKADIIAEVYPRQFKSWEFDKEVPCI
jgi:hypothetical protein